MIVLKIQRISHLQHTLSFFSISENYEAYYTRFLASNLGKIHASIPWDELVSSLDLKESRLGRKAIFSPKGRLGLMFLKQYLGCSDEKLIEQLNSNLDLQFFCDIELGFERLDNFKIVSQIRSELAQKLAIDKTEKVLYSHWKDYISCPDQILIDATCYESWMRYPTNEKLLWESISWLYSELKKTYDVLHLKMPRTKYLKWEKRYHNFSKTRRKKKSERKVLKRALLHLMDKLLGIESQLRQDHKDLEFVPRYYKRLNNIKIVLKQQRFHFETGERIKNRIVSIDKEYVRPIVRGKEVKPVEFGAKVNKVQIDGINFIEYISFDAFNEGTRLVSSIQKVQMLTRKKVKILGADAIYSTNKNRSYVSSKSIFTDFISKGKKPKNYAEIKKVKGQIRKERATRLEGSFGNEKEHYGLRKIKARTQKTEILCIFFGIHTANALQIGKRMFAEKIKEKAA